MENARPCGLWGAKNMRFKTYSIPQPLAIASCGQQQQSTGTIPVVSPPPSPKLSFTMASHLELQVRHHAAGEDDLDVEPAPTSKTKPPALSSSVPRAVPIFARLTYRPELDGLRAVAIVPVVLFHFKVAGWTGGYAGVDVFFTMYVLQFKCRLISALQSLPLTMR